MSHLSTMLKPPTVRQIKLQVKNLRKNPNIECDKRGELLAFLVDLELENKFERMSGATLFNKFYTHWEKQHPKDEAIEDREGAGKRLAIALRQALIEHYEHPGPEDRIKIALDKDGQRFQAYRPSLSWLEKTKPATAAVVSVSPARILPDSFRVEPVGNNAAALRYVIKHISEFNRIEETFTRWANPKALYQGPILGQYVEAVATNKVLYRAVIGPYYDDQLFTQKGLRKALANRGVVDLPEEKKGEKIYRLLHATPMVNFTLLYRADPNKDWFDRTDDIEVLFGFGVHSPNTPLEDTVVYSSKDFDLAFEFVNVFKALTDPKISREIPLSQPDLFLVEPDICDVLATFRKFPESEIGRRLAACGTAKRLEKDCSPEDQIDDPHAPSPPERNNPHIDICVTAWSLIGLRGFDEKLRQALEHGVKTNIAFWHPEHPYLESRERVSGDRPGAVAREIEGDRQALENLKHKNLSVHWCYGELASVSIFWIDDLIYFSTYWVGKSVGDGPHFLVAANSLTGIALRRQYGLMLTTSVPEISQWSPSKMVEMDNILPS